VRNSDDDRVITFIRADATEDVLVAINLTNRTISGTVEVAGTGYAEITPWAPSAAAAIPALVLDPWGVRIFRRDNSSKYIQIRPAGSTPTGRVRRPAPST
jgi:hypothetical protein